MKTAFLHPLGLCVLAVSIAVATVWPQVPGLSRLAVPSAWLLFWGFTGYIATGLVLAWPGDARDVSDAGSLEAGWSDESVARQVRADSLQEPLTLLPLAAAALVLAHALLLAPSDLRVLEVSVGVTGFLLAAAFYFWNSVIRYSERHDARVAEVMKQIDSERSRRDATDTERLRLRLEDGFKLLNASVAGSSLRRLDAAHLQLHQILQARRTSDPLSLNLVPGMAQETYHRGLSVLDDVLELMRANHGFEGSQLREEIHDVERESAGEEGNSEWRALHEQRLALYRRRLAGHERVRLDIDRLLYQAARCETSLYETRLHLAGIRAGTSEEGLASVIEALHRTVEQARETQDELRRLAQ
jgi:hypothetical protein